MAKEKTFKTIFPAVSVPLNDDYSINEEEFRVYLRWIKSFYGKGIEGLVCNGHTGEITGLTRAERKRVTEICAEECGDVMTIISNALMRKPVLPLGQEEKDWVAQGIKNSGLDKVDVTVILISGSIVLVGAIVLHPDGIAIKAPAQLGDLLRPFLGNAAPIVMGIAIIGAGFSSLLGNTQRGVVLLNAGLDKETGLESKPVKILCIACLAVATIICFAYGGSPTQLIFIANVATSVATPVAGLFMVLILWKKELFTGYKTPRVLQISMTVCYIFAVYMTFIALRTQIPNLINSFK